MRHQFEGLSLVILGWQRRRWPAIPIFTAEGRNLVAIAFGQIDIVAVLMELVAIDRIDHKIEAVVVAHDRLRLEIDFGDLFG